VPGARVSFPPYFSLNLPPLPLFRREASVCLCSGREDHATISIGRLQPFSFDVPHQLTYRLSFFCFPVLARFLFPRFFGGAHTLTTPSGLSPLSLIMLLPLPLSFPFVVSFHPREFVSARYNPFTAPYDLPKLPPYRGFILSPLSLCFGMVASVMGPFSSAVPLNLKPDRRKRS